jgi:hypothetical protein
VTAEPVKDQAGAALLAGFEAEEGVFEGDVVVEGVKPHGLAEGLAGGGVLTDLKEGVGEVLEKRGAGGVERKGFAKEADGGGVVAFVERDVGAGCEGLGEVRESIGGGGSE